MGRTSAAATVRPRRGRRLIDVHLLGRLRRPRLFILGRVAALRSQMVWKLMYIFPIKKRLGAFHVQLPTLLRRNTTYLFPASCKLRSGAASATMSAVHVEFAFRQYVVFATSPYTTITDSTSPRAQNVMPFALALSRNGCRQGRRAQREASCR